MKSIVCTSIVTATLIGLAGCQSFTFNLRPKAPSSAPAVADLPPVPDRLRAFYQDTKSGRFEILSDFERPTQTQIFRVEQGGSSRLTVRKSRIPTGAGALEVTFENPQSVLIVDDQDARDWTLSRTWSPYQILMASIYAPVPIVVNMQIRSGTDQPAWWASNPNPLQPGWNLLRFDLGEIGRRVELADVRQIRLTAKTTQWPLTIYLDDLMLADNSQTVFGDPAGEPGSLYVLKKGHRYHVGAAGRFELVFSRGLLNSWYDLASDPDKAIDLGGGGPIGPVLTALEDSANPVGDIGIESWRQLGSGVQTQLQVVETNPLAVTIRGVIRFSAGVGAEDPADAAATQTVEIDAQNRALEAGTAAEPLEHSYTYTVRQDGRIFVDIQAAVATPTAAPAKVALAVTSLNALFAVNKVDPLERDLLETTAATKVAAPATAPAADATENGLITIPRAVLLSAVRLKGPNLLLAPANVRLFEKMVTAVRKSGDVAAQMYVMNPLASGRLHVAAMLAVWPADLRDLPTATAIAMDYQQPRAPEAEVGQVRKDGPGDLDGDGFSEGNGRWLVEADGQVLRLRWPAGQLRFWPMLQVAGLSGKACWPYLDGRILRPVARRADGDAEFVLPGILSRPALLEVTVEK